MSKVAPVEIYVWKNNLYKNKDEHVRGKGNMLIYHVVYTNTVAHHTLQPLLKYYTASGIELNCFWAHYFCTDVKYWQSNCEVEQLPQATVESDTYWAYVRGFWQSRLNLEPSFESVRRDDVYYLGYARANNIYIYIFFICHVPEILCTKACSSQPTFSSQAIGTPTGKDELWYRFLRPGWQEKTKKWKISVTRG